MGGRGREGGGYVSVFPHWWYIRCKIRPRHDPRSPSAPYTPRDAPCKLSRPVSSGAVLYVIGPRMPDSLHWWWWWWWWWSSGALPARVVLFVPGMARICWACCISMQRAKLVCAPPSPSDDVNLAYARVCAYTHAHLLSFSYLFYSSLSSRSLGASRLASPLSSGLYRLARSLNATWSRNAGGREGRTYPHGRKLYTLSGVKKYPDLARRTATIHG